MRERSAGDKQGVGERERVWIARPLHRAECRLVHQCAERKVRERIKGSESLGSKWVKDFDPLIGSCVVRRWLRETCRAMDSYPSGW